jgi:glycosyltransferase involved in cell wall biosynthesis
VVIPVKDDAGMLEHCLAALAEQTRPPDEVIVVDNASRDRTAEVARRHGATVVREARSGITAAASAGYDAASGDIIARCDADSRLPPEWLARIERAMGDRAEPAAVTGPGRFYDLGPVARFLADLLYMRAYFLLAAGAVARTPLFGSNFAIRTTVWRQVSATVPRDEPDLHDDLDLSLRLDPKREVRYEPELVVGISGRPFTDLRSMAKRTRRAGVTLRAHLPGNGPIQRWRRRLLHADRHTVTLPTVPR